MIYYDCQEILKQKILQKKQKYFDKPLDKSVKIWYNKYITNESSERKGLYDYS